MGEENRLQEALIVIGVIVGWFWLASVSKPVDPALVVAARDGAVAAERKRPFRTKTRPVGQAGMGVPAGSTSK